MRDMLEILKRARKKKRFQGNEFEELLMKIQSADSSLEMNWDDGAGEEWARFYRGEKGVVCMINAKIGIVFTKKSYPDRKIRSAIDTLEIVPVESYSVDEWRMDLDQLEQSVPEIFWHTSEEIVNANKFSLDGLYYATV